MPTKTCPTCGGSGGYWLEVYVGTRLRLTWITCSMCGGTGTLYVPDAGEGK